MSLDFKAMLADFRNSQDIVGIELYTLAIPMSLTRVYDIVLLWTSIILYGQNLGEVH